MTHRTAAVRSEVQPIEWAVFEPEVNPAPLTRRQYLAVLLSDRFAAHDVPAALVRELRSEYSENEISGLLLAAAIAHAGHVLNEAVRLSPAEGAACEFPAPKGVAGT